MRCPRRTAIPFQPGIQRRQEACQSGGTGQSEIRGRRATPDSDRDPAYPPDGPECGTVVLAVACVENKWARPPTAAKELLRGRSFIFPEGRKHLQ